MITHCTLQSTDYFCGKKGYVWSNQILEVCKYSFYCLIFLNKGIIFIFSNKWFYVHKKDSHFPSSKFSWPLLSAVLWENQFLRQYSKGAVFANASCPPPPETGSKSVKGFESYFLSVSQALLQFRTPEASRTQSSPRKLTSVLWKRCWHKASNSTKLSQTTCEDAAINSVSVCDGEKCWLICVDIILAGRTNHYIKNLAKRNSLFIHLLLYLPLSYWNMCGVLCMPLHTCAD